LKLVFITGGARSGKSSFAQKYAESIEGVRTYIATAIPFDKEMEERIKKHQQMRDSKWHNLIEEPYDLKKVVSDLNKNTDVALIDCITIWINNLLYKFENNIEKTREEIDKFIENILQIEYNLFIVSNEVGMGIIPDNKLARIFRDISGETNQKIAKIADEFYTSFSGFPLRLK
jgi:adenosylcobinamide kinase/adenosylcobinamide-phosphate guanylyltransferase